MSHFRTEAEFPRNVESIARRLWPRIEKRDDGCWIWTGATTRGGRYGVIGRGAKSEGNILTHVASYLEHVGPIPARHQLDHLCRVTLCCNPTHLEAVTQAENLRRQQAAITHCKYGHAFDDANTYTPPGTTKRQCRTCNRRRNVEQYNRRKVAA